jgi:ribosomal protein L27
VGVGKDYTLYALTDGTVKFEPATKYRRKVSVYAA